MNESDIARALASLAKRNYWDCKQLTIEITISPSSRERFLMEIILRFPNDPAPGRVRESPSSRMAKPKPDPVATAEAEVQSLTTQLDDARRRLVEARKGRNLIEAESR